MDGPKEGRAGLFPALVVVSVLLLLAAGCCVFPGNGGGTQVEEITNRTVGAAGVSALEVQGIDGGCEVHQWAEPRISIQATKRSRFGQAELDRVSVSVTEGSTVTIRTVHPTSTARVTVDYVILVPASVETIRIETSNGAVLVDGVSAEVSAQTSNGAVRAFGVGGGASLRTSNGAVEVRGANGTVAAQTSNGALTVENAAALGDLETSNGRILAEVRAVNDDVTFRTSNGNIELELAPGLDAVIDAESSSGRVSVTAGLLSVNEQSANRLRGTAGAGSHTITVRTSNGEIRIGALG